MVVTTTEDMIMKALRQSMLLKFLRDLLDKWTNLQKKLKATLLSTLCTKILLMVA